MQIRKFFSKKHLFFQVLRIAAFLSWDISELSDSPALQLLLLETYITVIDTEDVIIERHEDGRPIYEGMNTPVKQFAFILFHRWVLLSLPLLNYPMPPGNKAQIFNNSSSNYFCLIDPETAVTLNAQSTGAFESMQGYYENEEKEFHDFLDTMPSKGKNSKLYNRPLCPVIWLCPGGLRNCKGCCWNFYSCCFENYVSLFCNIMGSDLFIIAIIIVIIRIEIRLFYHFYFTKSGETSNNPVTISMGISLIIKSWSTYCFEIISKVQRN